VNLVMVGFHGDGDGVGELTWSQANLWQGMTLDGPPISMGGKVSPPTPLTADDVAETVRFTVSRHQSLRTKLKLRGDKPPLQVCVSSGEMPLEVIEAGDDDPDALAEQVEKRYRNTPFDYENEFPVRTAVVLHNGIARWVVTIYLHLAMDMGALDALANDIISRDPVTGDAAGPVTSIQPLELAAKQQQPPALRKSAAAMTYLEQVLRVMPLRQFGEPRYPDEGQRILRLRSRAAALAIQRIAATESTSTSSAVLAAFAVGVTRYTGHPNVMAMLLVSNRFRPGFADAVSPVVQMSPCLIDVAGATLRDAVIRTGSSVLTAYKHAYYDPYEQDAVYDRVEAERGQLEYWSYNDRRDLDRSAAVGPMPTDDEIRAALGSTEHRWVPTKSTSTGIYLTVLDGPDDTVEFELMAESRFLSENDMVALTTEIETAAVRTALEPDLATDFPGDSPKSGEVDPGREVIHHV